MKIWFVIAICICVLAGAAFAMALPEYDIVIRQAVIIDGTGNAGVTGDVAVKDRKIVMVASRITGKGTEEIDAQGLVVAPGFIDMHTHTDRTIFSIPLADNKIHQGVTTEVINNCGVGPFPLNPESKRRWLKVYRENGYNPRATHSNWFNFRHYAAVLEHYGVGVNLIPLVPHGPLRSAVIGLDDREPTETELSRMEGLLEQAMRDGAWGLSTGLVYVPGCFAKTDELIRLAKVVAKYDGLYASHVRSGGMNRGINEAIQIGRESGVRVQISHLKARRGQGPAVLAKLAAARSEGLFVYADHYPYHASYTGLAPMVPPWVRAGGNVKMLSRLAAPELRERILRQISRRIEATGGPEKIMVIPGKKSGKAGKNAELAGKRLSEISQIWGCSPAEAVCRLLLEEKGAVGAIYFIMYEADVLAIAANPDVAVGSDAGGIKTDSPGNTLVHPRGYGTFTKLLGELTRERKLLSLEQAVYKMTGLPAYILGLNDRGLIKDGLAADIVLFNPRTVADRADYINPHRYSEGFSYVMINGRWVIKNGLMTGVKAGKILRKGR